MTAARIAAHRPADVAHEVELRLKEGWCRFVLERVDDGQMRDLERLGAARYAAGLQAQVELAAEVSSATSKAAPASSALGAAPLEAR